MNKVLPILLILLSFSCCINAQTQFGKIKDIQVSIGVSSVFSNMKKPEQMRTEPFNYDNYNIDNPFFNSSSLTIYHAGVKPEFALSRKWSFLAGVHFMLTQFAINADNDYFYWLYKQDGTNSYFAQIKKINQLAFFAGIPMELRLTCAKFKMAICNVCESRSVIRFSIGC
jgi:hypothetical protein